jgi:hypothetical protein
LGEAIETILGKAVSPGTKPISGQFGVDFGSQLKFKNPPFCNEWLLESSKKCYIQDGERWLGSALQRQKRFGS